MSVVAQARPGEDAGLQVLPGGSLHQGELSLPSCQGQLLKLNQTMSINENY